MRRVVLVRESYADPPSLGTALARVTLQGVASGLLPETFRLSRPPRIVAFGSRDRVSPGFGQAIAAASDAGFSPVQRLAGGQAAAFHEGTVAFSWAIPDRSPREGMRTRFQVVSAVIADALRSLGVDARVGPVPGEYCPGDFSVNARRRRKLMGVGQRVVAGGAHLGGVLVVTGSDVVRAALLPVYEALGLAWDPASTGSIQDEVTGISWAAAEAAIVSALSTRFEVEEGTLPAETIGLAQRLAPQYALVP